MSPRGRWPADSVPQSCSSASPDTVKFGEVALQPPELTAKPRTTMSRGRVSGGRGPGEQGQGRGPGPVSRGRGRGRGLPFVAVVSAVPTGLTAVGPALAVTSPFPELAPSVWSSAQRGIPDGEDARESWRCVPAFGHLTGLTADLGGGERAGCEGLQGAQEAAAATAGGAGSSPPSQEEAGDVCVMVRPGVPHWAGGPQMEVPSLDTPWDPGPQAPAPQCGSRPWFPFWPSLETALSRVAVCHAQVSRGITSPPGLGPEPETASFVHVSLASPTALF